MTPEIPWYVGVFFIFIQLPVDATGLYVQRRFSSAILTYTLT